MLWHRISHILLINSPFYTNNNYSFIHTYIQESFILWDICGWNLILVGEGWYLLFNVDTLYIVHYCRWFSNNSTLNWSSMQQQRDVISWQAAELFGFQIRRCNRFLPLPTSVKLIFMFSSWAYRGDQCGCVFVGLEESNLTILR